MKITNILVLFAVVLLNGCNAQTTKNLTEITARDLIRDYVHTKKVTPTISFDLKALLLKATNIQASTPSTGPGINAMLKRMIDHKYIVQTLHGCTFSPEFMKFIVLESTPPAPGRNIVIGSYEIGEVTRLVLNTETRAEATFTLKTLPNEVAHVLSDNSVTVVENSAGAEFAKKPDGSWFVDSLK